MAVYRENNRLIIKSGVSQVWIDPWGENSFRVRMTKEPQMDANDWALCEKVKETQPIFKEETVDATDPWYKSDEYKKYHQTGVNHYITNGKITAKVSYEGYISFYNHKGELLTEEYWRNRNRLNRYCVPLRVDARELKCYVGSTDYELYARFEAFDDEKIFGMGQYQEKHLIKRELFWSFATETVRQACRFTFQAGDTAFCGTIRLSEQRRSVQTKPSGMQKAQRSLTIS